MPFKRMLKELVDSVPGATGAILADWEGESVELFCHFDEFDMKVIGAHKGIILARLRELHSSLNVGEVEDFVISAGNQRHIAVPVGPDYFLIMTLERTALLALALAKVRMVVDLLEKEIY